MFLSDESWKQTISDVYRSLKTGGHFIFDTRNPLAKAWEEWEKDTTPDLAKDLMTGDMLEIHTEYEGFTGNIFTFVETVKHANSGEMLIREKMQLRFRKQIEIEESLRQTGFSRIYTYGDWELKQTSSESKSLIFHSIR